MFGKVQVGLTGNDIKRRIERYLKDNSPSIQASLRNEIAKSDNVDEKITLAVSAAIENVLPEIISAAIAMNNDRMTRTLEELLTRR